MKRVGVVVLVAAVLAVALPAGAATPAGGTVTKSKRTAKWKGGPFTVSDPVDPVGLGFPPEPSCSQDPMCDHFSLKVTLGEGARIEVKITTANPNPPGSVGGVTSLQPITGDDYDVYVFDPNGILITGDKGASEKGNEKVTFTHKKRFNGKAYDVAVRPWAVMPGSTYSGSATVVAVGR